MFREKTSGSFEELVSSIKTMEDKLKELCGNVQVMGESIAKVEKKLRGH